MMEKKPIHPAMDRLYKAAIELKQITGNNPQSEFATWLTISPQRVNNWEARGPSKEIRIQCQNAYAINSTWVETGDGEMFINKASTSSNNEKSSIPKLDKSKTKREKIIEEITLLLKVTDDFGLGSVLREAKDAANEHPLKTQKSYP